MERNSGLTKSDIVRLIAESGIVENLIASMKASRNEDRDNLKDLSQDIYMDLLEKPEELLVQLWNSGEYKFYLTRMITNNIFSKTSPYDRKYRGKRDILPDA